METTNLIAALGPAFAAGFSLQRLLEILDPLLTRIIGDERKRIVLGLLSLAVGLLLAFALDLHVLSKLGVSLSPRMGYLDYLVTALVVSAGTEGFNSILKFLSYKKEESHATAATEKIKVNAIWANAVSRLTLEDTMDVSTALANATPNFTPGAAMHIAYRSVTTTTGSGSPVTPLATLAQYNALAQDLPAIRSRILNDNSYGLPLYRRTMDPNALKDMSTGWTLQKLADIVYDESTPIPV